MARPSQEAIDTFISITGVTESVAVQKLEEHGGDLNAAVNAHFSEGDRNTPMNTIHQSSVPAAQDEFMDIDNPIESWAQEPPLSLLSGSRTLNPFSLLDQRVRRSFLDGGSDFMRQGPYVTQPKEVREIPIEVKNGGDPSGHAPTIEDVADSVNALGPDTRETVIIDEVNEDIPAATAAQSTLRNVGPPDRHTNPTATAFDSLPDYSNDIEEEMIRAAIEASKRDAENVTDSGTEHKQLHLEDTDLAHAVALSLKTAEQDKALRELRREVGASIAGASEPSEMELGKVATSNGRIPCLLEPGNSSIQEEAEDVELQPLVRRRSRHTSFGFGESAKEVGSTEVSSPSSPGQPDVSNQPQHNGNALPSDKWGGISSEEHDEAVMLEAAMFGGISESGYRFPYAPHHYVQPKGPYPSRVPRPPSPSLEAQRLIREQQDDEYLASLQADREKAEAHRLMEEEARKAAFEEEGRKEEETCRKMEEELEYERQLAAKEASLPQEPALDDENAVTLLVRMPDGSRRGRRFLKSNKLQAFFDFIDVGRVIKAGTYRLCEAIPKACFQHWGECFDSQ